MKKKEQLIEKYRKNSKHSNYQILSRRLSEIVGKEDVCTRSRFEKERLDYILDNVDIKNRSVLDIGGNTGFFTFELIDAGAKNLIYYEGNAEHAEFVDIATEVLGLKDKISVLNEYFDFNNSGKYDIVLLLNVLHHVGDDYGDKNITINEARQAILRQLNRISDAADILVFQLGFNWQGNVDKCLFENGTKKEMIDFITEGIVENWEVIDIGIAEDKGGSIKYCSLNEKNIERNDKLGEFLNRPLFILKSKK